MASRHAAVADRGHEGGGHEHGGAQQTRGPSAEWSVSPLPLPPTSAATSPGPTDVRGRQNSPLRTVAASNLPTAATRNAQTGGSRLSRLRRTLLALQTPIPPPPPPQLCLRHVPEPGYTPRGRGGEKRTCSRPCATGCSPLCAGFSPKPVSSSVRLKNEGPHSIISQADYQGDLPWPMTERPSVSMGPERLT